MPQEQWSNRSRTLVSRRQFLARGAAVVPAIVLVPGGRAAGAEGPTEYVLRAGRFRAAPDGRPREVWGYNGQFPGPPIRAREGETLRVKVVNGLAVPTSVHWHGMHQPGTWRMDGVAGVTGPPIAPGAEFVYEFKATPAGTHWYHSHVGVQYSDGLLGPLVVEESRPIAAYDREETLVLNDWFLRPSEELLAGLLKRPAMKMPAPKEGAAGRG